MEFSGQPWETAAELPGNVASALIVDGGGGVHSPSRLFWRGQIIATTNISTPYLHRTDYVAPALVGSGVTRKIFEHKKKYN
jgi:hypothetical protein